MRPSAFRWTIMHEWARSSPPGAVPVMAGAALVDREPRLDVVTAGTFSVDGQPISWRTREALQRVGLEARQHRSKQITREHVESSDLIIGLAPEHVQWIRREHPDMASRTATLRRLVRDLRSDGPLTDRVSQLALHRVELEPWEEVIDPGGGELDDFVACAIDVVALIDGLVDRLRPIG